MNNHSRPRSPQPGPACESIAPLLALVGQERLTGRDASDLRTHLTTCAYCQQELQTYDWLDDTLARHFGPAPRGPLSLADIRALASRDYQIRTPPPETLAPEQRLGRPERAFRPEQPRRPMRPKRRPRGRRLISILSALAAVLIIAAIGLALFASHPNKSGSGGPTPESSYIPQQQDVLNGISMLSASDGWAVGGSYVSDGVTEILILHYDGNQWNRVSSPSNQDLRARSATLTQISMVSADEGWAVGNATVDIQTNSMASEPFILHYTGGHWTAQTTLPVNSALTGIAMTSASNGWAVGALDVDSGPGSSTSLLLNYNGQNWSQVQAPGGGLSSITMTSASDGWILGAPAGSSGTASLLLHYNGSQWAQVPVPSAFDQLFALSFVSPSDGWAVGIKYLANPNGALARYSGTPAKIVFAHYDGRVWGDIQTPITYNQSGFAGINSLFMDSSSDGWAVGIGNFNTTSGNVYLHFTGGKWALVNGPGMAGLNGVFLTSANEGWAVGNSGALIHYRNGAWSPAVSAPTSTPTPTSTAGAQGCASQGAPPPGAPGTTVTPVPFSNWSTYTNTKYGYALQYPANWEADNVACPDSGSLLFFNYNSSIWNSPGFPAGGIKIELDAEDNSAGMSALQFWEMVQQNDQQGVGGPGCQVFTTQQLTIAGRAAVEGGCPAQHWDTFYIPDGNVMLSISESTAADGDTSYTVLKQMVNSLMFTN